MRRALKLDQTLGSVIGSDRWLGPRKLAVLGGKGIKRVVVLVYVH